MEIYRNTNDYASLYGTWGSVHSAVRQKPVVPKDTRTPRQSDVTSLFYSVILRCITKEHYCCYKVPLIFLPFLHLQKAYINIWFLLAFIRSSG